MNNMQQLKGIYFYNGFNKPNKLADNLNDFMDDLKNKNTVLTTNYLGDVSNDLLDELTETLEDDQITNDDITNILYDYSLFYNPTIKAFQDININRFNLDKNEYLKEIKEILNMQKEQTSKSVAKVLDEQGNVIGYLTADDEEQGKDIQLDLQGYTIVAIDE